MYLCTALQEARPSRLAARISPITDVLSLITKPAPHRGSPQHHREGRWVVGGGGGGEAGSMIRAHQSEGYFSIFHVDVIVLKTH